MIGLGFDPSENMDSVIDGSSKKEPIDMAKFALEAASVGATKAVNPFSPIGVTGSRFLGSTTWGGGASAANTSLSDLGALSGWDFTASSTDEATESGGLHGSNLQASKSSQSFISFPPLSDQNNAWGSSAFDGGLSGFTSFGSEGNKEKPHGVD